MSCKKIITDLSFACIDPSIWSVRQHFPQNIISNTPNKVCYRIVDICIHLYLLKNGVGQVQRLEFLFYVWLFTKSRQVMILCFFTLKLDRLQYSYFECLLLKLYPHFIYSNITFFIF